MLVPAEKIERIINAVIEEAHEQTRRDFDLPAGEGVVVEIGTRYPSPERQCPGSA